MTDNCHLQALFSPPRNTENPKLAFTYTPQFSTGEDGKLYKLATESDRNKFHVLSDAEVEEELRVSQEMASTLRTINPNNTSKQKTKNKATTVKLGTGNRSNKIERRAWEKKLADQEQATVDEGDNEESSGETKTKTKGPELSSEEALLQSVADMQKKYTANLTVIERLISEKVQMEEKVKELQKQLRQSKKLNQFQSAQQFKKNKDEQLVKGNETIKSVEALKTYYHQNLDLIETLYAQQKASEVKLVTCQNELAKLKAEKKSNAKTGTTLALSPDDPSVTSVVDNNDKYLRNLNVIEQLFAERKGLTAEVHSLKQQLWSLKRSTAMNEPDTTVVHSGKSDSKEAILAKGSLNHTAPGALQKLAVDKIMIDEIENIEEEEQNDGSDDDEDELPTFNDDEDGDGLDGKGTEGSLDPSSGASNVRNVMHLKRSSSPTAKGKKTAGSKKDPYLDKIRQSEEKYFEKKKLAAEREQQEKLEQEMYEYELEQKRLRASKTKRQVVTINGKEKTVVVAEGLKGMAERDQLIAQRKAERDAKKKEKDAAEALEKELLVKKEHEKVKRLTESIARSRQKEEALKKAKEEEAGNVKESSKKEKAAAEAAARPKPKLSPEEITENLQKQQQAWDAKIAKEKEAKKAKLIQTKQDKSVTEMLQRQEERERKLREKHIQREMEAKAAADLKAEEEIKRREKLRKKTQLNGAMAKENAAKAKLEETLRLEEEEKKSSKKKKQKTGSQSGPTPQYKNAADLIKTLKNKPAINEDKINSDENNLNTTTNVNGDNKAVEYQDNDDNDLNGEEDIDIDGAGAGDID